MVGKHTERNKRRKKKNLRKQAIIRKQAIKIQTRYRIVLAKKKLKEKKLLEILDSQVHTCNYKMESLKSIPIEQLAKIVEYNISNGNIVGFICYHIIKKFELEKFLNLISITNKHIIEYSISFLIEVELMNYKKWLSENDKTYRSMYQIPN